MLAYTHSQALLCTRSIFPYSARSVVFFPSRAIALSLVELCGFAASELAAAKMITKL